MRSKKIDFGHDAAKISEDKVGGPKNICQLSPFSNQAESVDIFINLQP